jgi:hypothetical protein
MKIILRYLLAKFSLNNSGKQVQSQFSSQFQQNKNLNTKIILGEKDLPLEPNNLPPMTENLMAQNHPQQMQEPRNLSPDNGISPNCNRDTSNSFPSHSRSIRNSRTR